MVFSRHQYPEVTLHLNQHQIERVHSFNIWDQFDSDIEIKHRIFLPRP